MSDLSIDERYVIQSDDSMELIELIRENGDYGSPEEVVEAALDSFQETNSGGRRKPRGYCSE